MEPKKSEQDLIYFENSKRRKAIHIISNAVGNFCSVTNLQSLRSHNNHNEKFVLYQMVRTRRSSFWNTVLYTLRKGFYNFFSQIPVGIRYDMFSHCWHKSGRRFGISSYISLDAVRTETVFFSAPAKTESSLHSSRSLNRTDSRI